MQVKSVDNLLTAHSIHWKFELPCNRHQNQVRRLFSSENNNKIDSIDSATESFDSVAGQKIVKWPDLNQIKSNLITLQDSTHY